MLTAGASIAGEEIAAAVSPTPSESTVRHLDHYKPDQFAGFEHKPTVRQPLPLLSHWMKCHVGSTQPAISIMTEPHNVPLSS